MHRIVIVGGGFGGVTVAKELAKKNLPDCDITLISDRSHLEYYGVLYRLIRGESPDEACLPLDNILPRSVHRAVDAVRDIDPKKKIVRGLRRSFPYDTLVLAPGSVPAYFGIQGMEQHSITMKSAADAVAIRKRVKEQIDLMAQERKPEARRALARFIVIGGGPTGIEAAGEILPLAQKTAHQLGISCRGISVTLLEGADRLMPSAEPRASRKILGRLQRLGVDVRLQCVVSSADVAGVTLKTSERLEAATILWTAGVKAHPLLETVEDLELDKRGRAVVDKLLRIPHHDDIFVLGDCAATPYAGMAQTAVEDGHFVTEVITAMRLKKKMPVYTPKPPAYAIPAGAAWSAVKFGPLRVYGFLGAILRRAADIHVYMLILPWRYIPAAFFGHSNGPSCVLHLHEESSI